VTDNAGSLTMDSAQLPAALVGGRLDVNIGAAAAVPVTDNSSSLSVDDNGGALSVDDNGGSLTVDGTVTANQGTAAAAANAWPTKVSDGTDTVGISTVGAVKALKVDVVQSVGAGAQVDKTAFTEGSGLLDVAGGVYNEAIGSDPTEDQAAALRITAKRGLHVNLRNVSGTEVATAGAPLRVDPTGSTTQPISDGGGSLTVDQPGNWSSNVAQFGGSAVVAAAAGIPKVGLTDEAGAAFSDTNPLPVATVPLGRTPVRRYTSAIASQTDVAVWTPAAGKKWIIETIILSVTGSGDLSLHVNLVAAANYVLKTAVVTGGNPIQITFPNGHPCDAINDVLRYTSGAGLAAHITIFGYEV